VRWQTKQPPAIERVLTLDERIAAVGRGRDVAAANAERRKLAEQCLRGGRTDDAIALYEEALAAAGRDDPVLTFGLAHARFAAEDFTECTALLERLRRPEGGFNVPEMQLLLARSLEGAGRLEAARDAFKSALDICPGEEARCRYAQLLRREGEVEAAQAEFRAVIRSVAKADKSYDASQRQWLELARRHVGA